MVNEERIGKFLPCPECDCKPVVFVDEEKDLREEVGDVILLMKTIFDLETNIDKQLTDKARRWVERIRKQNANE